MCIFFIYGEIPAIPVAYIREGFEVLTPLKCMVSTVHVGINLNYVYKLKPYFYLITTPPLPELNPI